MKQNHPVIRLLNADHAALVISFCYQAFIRTNLRSISEAELESNLEDYLVQLRQLYGDDNFSRSAREYLDYWSGDSCEFLRKYYPQRSEQSEYDLTPATEKVITWLHELQPREFIGTESQLLVVFRLLQDITELTEQDQEMRLKTLQQQRKEIDEAIKATKRGQKVVYNKTQIKERFLQAEGTARKLLSEFRQIEYNFRQLDRQTREQITQSDNYKGEILDEIFLKHDVIRTSDQGRSFQAFWELLMSPQKQQELNDMLTAVYKLDEIQGIADKNFLKNIYFSLLDAGEKIYRTTQLLSEQLRKFLDDQVYLENKRLMQLMRSIEKHMLNLKTDLHDKRSLMEINTFRASIENIMSRSLYAVPYNPIVIDTLQSGNNVETDCNILFQQWYVVQAELEERIEKFLIERGQFTLKELLAEYPLEKGLAELVMYVKIASISDYAALDLQSYESVQVADKTIKLNKIIFIRK